MQLVFQALFGNRMIQITNQTAAMPSKQPDSDLPIHPFASAADFESFLEREHSTAPGIQLKLAKKSSGIPSVTAAEAVETALCFGWIDGQAHGLDQNWWLVRYTPRRKKSMWSKKNVDTVARLIDQGRIRPAGIAAIDAAKADGRWDRAYAGPASIVTPSDFSEALSDNEPAALMFESMNKSERYAVLWRIETASVQARAKRIEALVQQLASGCKPGSRTKQQLKNDSHGSEGTRPTRIVKDQASVRKKYPATHADVQVKRRTGLRSQSTE